MKTLIILELIIQHQIDLVIKNLYLLKKLKEQLRNHIKEDKIIKKRI